MKTLLTRTGALAVCLGFSLTLGAAQLPDDFPGITVTTYDSNKVDAGYVFLAVASETEGVGTYLMILKNDGTPVWYQKVNAPEVYDFKVQPNGWLSYAPFIESHSYTGGGDVYHELRDDSYNLKETVTGGNGYVAEGHDFQLLPNGDILQFGYYMSEVDMSQLIAGGNPAALVSGGVIQELDAQRNVVWQWRSWDHYPIEGAASTRAVISQFHLNDIRLDIDGNLIVGTPSEIRKINRQTGDVMWTLGGDDNDFTPVGDGADVSHFGGHGTYRIPNGNFLMYDNGNRPGTVSSKVHEYRLDETNLTATLVWSWEPPTIYPGWHRGNAQRLPNGNTFIGWGGARNVNIPACTEVTPDGEIVFEMYFDDTSPQVESYRAFRFRYPPSTQLFGDYLTEVILGNTYTFEQSGVTVEITDLTGSGYNDMTATRQPYAPILPAFAGKAPIVEPVRLTVGGYSIDTIQGNMSFDAELLGLDHPEDLTVYYRPTPGVGVFVPIPTSPYNPVTKQVRATMSGFGEFIFGRPDVADVAYPPILARPENYRGVQTSEVIAPRRAESNTVCSVNQALPILLSWSPKGFARGYDLEVATSEDFSNPVIQVSGQQAGFYIWSNALPATTYHWRARALIENNGTISRGDWSSNTFVTVAPSLQVTSPDQGEAWQRGLSYFIQWEDNFPEDVRIELYQDDSLREVIATNAPSTGAYSWEVGLGLTPGTNYSVKISSVDNASLSDLSDGHFSIDVPEITGLTPTGDGSGSMVLQWGGSSADVYVQFTPGFSPTAWTNIAGPISGNAWTNAPQPGIPQGAYRLQLDLP